MIALPLDRSVVSSDPVLLYTFARRRRPLSAMEVVRAMSGTGARLSEVLEDLARARASGLLGTFGFRGDTLLYELTDEGREAIALDRAAYGQ